MQRKSTAVRMFWLVCREGEKLEGTFRHTNATSAQLEAQRLAKTHPGVRFFVMQFCGSAVSQNVVWEAPDDLPF